MIGEIDKLVRDKREEEFRKLVRKTIWTREPTSEQRPNSWIKRPSRTRSEVWRC